MTGLEQFEIDSEKSFPCSNNGINLFWTVAALQHIEAGCDYPRPEFLAYYE